MTKVEKRIEEQHIRMIISQVPIGKPFDEMSIEFEMPNIYRLGEFILNAEEREKRVSRKIRIRRMLEKITKDQSISINAIHPDKLNRNKTWVRFEIKHHVLEIL